MNSSKRTTLGTPELNEDPKPTVTIAAQWFSKCQTCGVTDERMAHAYLDNLKRLGLLIETTETYTESVTEPYGASAVTIRDKMTSEFQRALSLSDFGQLFCDVCVRDF